MSRQVSKTVKLTPTTWYNPNSSYCSVSNESNAYTTTDSTTYATYTNNRSGSTSTVQFVLRGFNFDSIPSDAEVTNYSIMIKGYGSGISTTNTKSTLVSSGTNSLGSSYTATVNFGTSSSSPTLITFPTSGLSFSTIRSYGSNFGINNFLNRSKKNTTSYLYIYGAEIDVSYNCTEYYIDITNNSSVVTMSKSSEWVDEGIQYVITFTNVSNISYIKFYRGSTDVTSSLVHTTGTTYTYTISSVTADYDFTLIDFDPNVNYYDITATSNYQNADISPVYVNMPEGNSQEFRITVDDISNINVSDNSVNVNNQLVYHARSYQTAQTGTFTPIAYANDYVVQYYNNTYFTNPSNFYGDANSGSYGQWYSVTGEGSETIVDFLFNIVNIPQICEITSVNLSFKCYLQGGAYHDYRYAQLYSGNTAKGSPSGNLDASTSVRTLDDCGSWTREELDSLKLRIYLKRGSTNTTTNYYVRFYGATLTITYREYDEAYYSYTVSNIQADHTIVINEASSTPPSYIKVNGQYVSISKIWKKVNNVWVEQTDYSNLFDNNHIYVHP